MQLRSLYWKDAVLSDDDRRSVDTLFSAQLPAVERREALAHLLTSGAAASRGIGLDFFRMRQADARYGSASLIDSDIETLVRKCAIRELQAPPCVRIEPTAKPRRGANHASALAALAYVSEPSDADLVVRVMLENDDEDVLREGVLAADPILHGAPAHRALFDVLLKLSRRDDVDPEIRGESIRAIRGANDEAVVGLLLDALKSTQLEVSSSAARGLLERDVEQYRSIVAPVAATWPTGESAPYNVHEIRQMLEGNA